MHLELLDIPEKKIAQLQKKGIHSIEELAAYLPRRYNDFRTITKVEDLHFHEGELVSVVGTLKNINASPKRVAATLDDGTGKFPLQIVWFNQYYIASQLQSNRQYVFCGKVTYNSQFENFSMASPLYFSPNPENFKRIAPVYSKIPGMATDYLENCINKAVSLLLVDSDDHDYLEPDVLKRLETVPYKQFLQKVHQPSDDQDISDAEKRIVVDNLFPFAMKMGEKKYGHVSKTSFTIKSAEKVEALKESLPFTLTSGQQNATNKLISIIKEGNRLDALIQGDVGCGKTIIAMMLMVAMVENGYQAVLMCPTSVLAEQHFKEFTERLAPLGMKTVLLSSGMKAREKKKALSDIYSGDVDIVIGTHAVIGKDVAFNNLGMAIVDEEHRFGVEQRNLLREKAKDGIHTISLSATPIPRTIATTIYGENTLVVNIKTKPEGRLPVKTIIYSNEEKVYQSIHNQVNQGKQAYVVCPIIEDSDSDIMDGVDSVESTFEKMTKWFSRDPKVRVGMIAGNMKPAEIKAVLDDFTSGSIHVLISTTIIEVGVNIPTATVIMVKNAERFGLAQLHQLRGRVGRGKFQSYCILLSNQADNARLQALAETNDGFEIAQKDLELRGTGDVVGTKQSGVDKYISLMLQNQDLYHSICQEVDNIFEGKLRYEKYAALAESN